MDDQPGRPTWLANLVGPTVPLKKNYEKKSYIFFSEPTLRLQDVRPGDGFRWTGLGGTAAGAAPVSRTR